MIIAMAVDEADIIPRLISLMATYHAQILILRTQQNIFILLRAIIYAF